MSHTDPHDHRREPVSPVEAEQAAAKGLIWDAEIVVFREPETRAEAAQLDPAAPIVTSPARSAGTKRRR